MPERKGRRGGSSGRKSSAAGRTIRMGERSVVGDAAQSLLAPMPLPLDTLAAFRPVGANWQLAGGLAGDPRHESMLTPAPGTGVLVCNPGKAKSDPLVTAWLHGDVELDLDFLLTTG